VLLVLDSGLVISQVSDNAKAFLDRDASELLGMSSQAVLGSGLFAELHRLAAAGVLNSGPSYLGRVAKASGDLDAVVHQGLHSLMLELEHAPAEPASALQQGSIHNTVQSLIDALPYAASPLELCEMAVERLFALTGFGRVLAYRFDQNDDGEVLSERAREGYVGYLGHWFPASDIPSQARALYVQNRFRLIANASQATSALLPLLDPATGAPTDLTYAGLRAVSPVHIEYMKNMGTQASMSISLVVRGRLWGMISCHDAQAQYVPYHTKLACQNIGQLVSLHLEAQVGRDEIKRRGDLRNELDQLIKAVVASRGDVMLLTEARFDLLQFTRAQGVAVVSGAHCHLVGKTPSRENVDALCGWLDAQYIDVFASSNLGAKYPPAHVFARTGSGVMAIATTALPHHYLIWFKEEQVSQIVWAGEPLAKLSILPSGASQRHPRTSFKSWVESRRGHSIAWDPAEIEAATELRSALLLEALRVAKDEAEKANLSKNRFLAVLSHELRTPLSPILLAAQMLEMRAVVPPNMAGLLPMIRRNVELEARLIDDLLDLTSIERGKLQVARREADLYPIIEHALEMLRADFAQKSVGLDVIREAQFATAFVDSARIQQVIWNLVRNALKFVATGGHVMVHVTNLEAGYIKIAVADDGIGIAPESLEEIFTPFRQADASIAMRFGGLGLGLSIARSLAELHGGTVSASSAGLGRGATFTITLPLVVAASQGPTMHVKDLTRSAGSLRILLVEDSADTAAAMTVFLETLDHEVEVAHSVAAALEKLRDGVFELLLCDLGLPDGHGHELARATLGQVPSIALSGFGQQKDIEDSLAAGFIAHLTKPFVTSELELHLAAVLAMRPAA
jgi:chemotaxis family two-component system sensor kinase Cph1